MILFQLNNRLDDDDDDDVDDESIHKLVAFAKVIRVMIDNVVLLFTVRV